MRPGICVTPGRVAVLLEKRAVAARCDYFIITEQSGLLADKRNFTPLNSVNE